MRIPASSHFTPISLDAAFNADRATLDGGLGAGTSAFGTIDRDYGAAAGAVGFETVVDAYPEERALREKLHQVGWSAGLIVEGHDGGHFGWTHRGIAAKYLAPAVLKHLAPLPVPRRGG